jgi:Sperm-tail PG-rich repeat
MAKGKPSYEEVPLPMSLNKLSAYKSPPKYSFPHKWKPLITDKDQVGPGQYGAPSVDPTSKFKLISAPCSFSKGSRFEGDGVSSKRLRSVSYPAPGSYDPSNTKAVSLGGPQFSVGKSQRIFPKFYFKDANSTPGPIYQVTDKTRKLEMTLLPQASSFAGRHGWYYDIDIKKGSGKPGIGAYNPRLLNGQQQVSFGVSTRPPLYNIATKGLPGPGKYDIKSHAIDDGSYSFGKAPLSAFSGFILPGRCEGFTMAQPTTFAPDSN